LRDCAAIRSNKLVADAPSRAGIARWLDRFRVFAVLFYRRRMRVDGVATQRVIDVITNASIGGCRGRRFDPMRFDPPT